MFGRRQQLGLREELRSKDEGKGSGTKGRKRRACARKLDKLRKQARAASRETMDAAADGKEPVGGADDDEDENPCAEMYPEEEDEECPDFPVPNPKSSRAKGNPKAKAKSAPKPGGKAKAKAKATPKAKAKSKAKAAPKAKGKAKAKAAPKAKAKSKAKAAPKARAKARDVDPDPADVEWVVDYVHSFDGCLDETSSLETVKEQVRYYQPIFEATALDIYWSRAACGLTFYLPDGAKKSVANFDLRKPNLTVRQQLITLATAHLLVPS